MTGLRRLIAISLVVFGVAIFYILFAGLLPNPGGGDGGGGANGGSAPSVVQTPGQATTQPGVKTVSAQEVATHNSASNCWIIISNKVYDVTSYLRSHPGGEGVIIQYCGKEATKAFQTKDIGSNHSSRAYNHLNSIYVGDLSG